ALLNSGFFEKYAGGAVHQVRGVDGQPGVAAGQFNAPAVMGKRQLIVNGDRMHHCFQFMETIIASPKHVQQQIHFARRGLYYSHWWLVLAAWPARCKLPMNLVNLDCPARTKKAPTQSVGACSKFR